MLGRVHAESSVKHSHLLLLLAKTIAYVDEQRLLALRPGEDPTHYPDIAVVEPRSLHPSWWNLKFFPSFSQPEEIA
jgi:hypothetical protein